MTYLTMIKYKTSRLFELAFLIPYCLVYAKSGLIRTSLQQYRQLGLTFGVIFQLIDDITDYNPLNLIVNLSQNNILNYVSQIEVKLMIVYLYLKFQKLAQKLSINLTEIWQMIITKYPIFANILHQSNVDNNYLFDINRVKNHNISINNRQ